jgi:hypothetical protein
MEFLPLTLCVVQEGNGKIMVGLDTGFDLTGKTMSQRRQAIALHEKSRFIDAETFCSLVVSCRKLNRADQSTAGLRGLYCLEDDLYYYIEEERLEQYWAERSSICQLV